MKELTWTERYNIHRARVGPFEIVANWSSGGYFVSFGGRQLKAHIPDLAFAKAAGIDLARFTLRSALAKLPRDEEDERSRSILDLADQIRVLGGDPESAMRKALEGARILSNAIKERQAEMVNAKGAR